VSLASPLAGAQTGATLHYIAVGTTKFNQEPPLSAPRDWALARLEQPICRFGVLDLQARPISELLAAALQKRIFQVAYHWDYKQWKLAYSGPCVVSRSFNQLQWRAIQQHFADAEQLLLHDCDTGGASSGSPILLDTQSGPVAIGINVGTYTRTQLLLKEGRVVQKLKPDVVANTAVNVMAFKHVLPELRAAVILETEGDIRRLQIELQARGLYRGPIDGVLGQATRSAIRAFEAASGQAMTGLPSQKVLDMLAKDRVVPSVHYSTGKRDKR
jgi:hypothetical protein